MQVLQHDSAVRGAAFVPVDCEALARHREAMLAVAIVMEQRESEDGVFVPREVWSEWLQHVDWRDWRK